jgi:hypothetical protein
MAYVRNLTEIDELVEERRDMFENCRHSAFIMSILLIILVYFQFWTASTIVFLLMTFALYWSIIARIDKDFWAIAYRLEEVKQKKRRN